MHGAWVERLGDDLLFNHQTPHLLALLLEEWKQRAPTYAFEAQRLFSRLLPLQNAERTAPILLQGDATLTNRFAAC
ncbi:MAG: hypothetical protein EBR81_07930 [Proteobacteria bacterium]|nr:hypothetical protein [Pseudomonadota bacterium]